MTASLDDKGIVGTAGLELCRLLAKWEKRDPKSFGQAEADLLLILRKVISLYDYSPHQASALLRLAEIRLACYNYEATWRPTEIDWRDHESRIRRLEAQLNLSPGAVPIGGYEVACAICAKPVRLSDAVATTYGAVHAGCAQSQRSVEQSRTKDLSQQHDY